MPPIRNGRALAPDRSPESRTTSPACRSRLSASCLEIRMDGGSSAFRSWSMTAALTAKNDDAASSQIHAPRIPVLPSVLREIEGIGDLQQLDRNQLLQASRNGLLLIKIHHQFAVLRDGLHHGVFVAHRVEREVLRLRVVLELPVPAIHELVHRLVTGPDVSGKRMFVGIDHVLLQVCLDSLLSPRVGARILLQVQDERLAEPGMRQAALEHPWC